MAPVSAAISVGILWISIVTFVFLEALILQYFQIIWFMQNFQLVSVHLGCRKQYNWYRSWRPSHLVHFEFHRSRIYYSRQQWILQVAANKVNQFFSLATWRTKVLIIMSSSWVIAILNLFLMNLDLYWVYLAYYPILGSSWCSSLESCYFMSLNWSQDEDRCI